MDMHSFSTWFNGISETINGYLWHDSVMILVLLIGVFLIIRTRFAPLHALTYGLGILCGRYDEEKGPGVISHFQALSAALSGTIGLGNIGGVTIAISLGGPGAVFWMWIVGLIGMGIKSVEVTQSMIYRNVSDDEDPHGGPMWVVSKGMAKWGGHWTKFGLFYAIFFCITLLISAATGGNMFQSWNVARVTYDNFGIPEWQSGLVMAILCGAVIIGGIRRIGTVAERLVPTMFTFYFLASLAIILLNFKEVPAMFMLIFSSAFSATDSVGAFTGGTVGTAFLWGMKRALFSNEAAQGSSPIAHSAVKTSHPESEGVVAGLEPFIDTICVCTMTALVILLTGVWNRPADVVFNQDQVNFSLVQETAESKTWQLNDIEVADEKNVLNAHGVFVVIRDVTPELEKTTDFKVSGKIQVNEGFKTIKFDPLVTASSVGSLQLRDLGLYKHIAGASLTSLAFDSIYTGFGAWFITIASWFFALSTIISWCYYGEQASLFLFGQKSIFLYKLVYCSLIVIATLGFITTDRELDNLSGLGTGFMLVANIPIIVVFSGEAIRAYNNYIKYLRGIKAKRV